MVIAYIGKNDHFEAKIKRYSHQQKHQLLVCDAETEAEVVRFIKTKKVDVCVCHKSHPFVQLKLIERLLMMDILIIYMSKTKEKPYQVCDHPNFVSLREEHVIFIEDAVMLWKKYIGKIEYLERHLRTMETKIEEEKWIKKAKLALINHKAMSEQDAHRYVIDLAMNERLSKTHAAKKILDEVKS